MKIRIMGDMAQLNELKKDLGQPWQRTYANRGGDPHGRLYLELDSMQSIRFLRALHGAVAPVKPT